MTNDETIRILVVDDDASLRTATCERLSTEGFETAATGDGEEALAMYRERPFHVVLVDLKMPGMSGWLLMQRLREEAGEPGPAIIVMTGQYEGIDDQWKSSSGVMDVLSKPIRSDELIAKIKEALRQRDDES